MNAKCRLLDAFCLDLNVLTQFWDDEDGNLATPFLYFCWIKISDFLKFVLNTILWILIKRKSALI